MNFEQKMASVRAVSGATADEFKKLSENARELGETTIYTATQMHCQRYPNLIFDTVFAFRIKKMQSKILFQEKRCFYIF
jgi:hypothetical protein